MRPENRVSRNQLCACPGDAGVRQVKTHTNTGSEVNRALIPLIESGHRRERDDADDDSDDDDARTSRSYH